MYGKNNILKEEIFYQFNGADFMREWDQLNNCEITQHGEEVIVNAHFSDPHFANNMNFYFKNDSDYFIKLKMLSSEPSFVQIFFKYGSGIYNEKGSIKLSTKKGLNNFLIKIPWGRNNIRIDPGENSGIYIIKDLSIYGCKKYNYNNF